MRMGALYLFTKSSGKCHYTIAAWHWCDSLTWSWILSWHPREPLCRIGSYWMRNIKGINLPVLGDFSFHTQRAMRGYYKKKPTKAISDDAGVK